MTEKLLKLISELDQWRVVFCSFAFITLFSPIYLIFIIKYGFDYVRNVELLQLIKEVRFTESLFEHSRFHCNQKLSKLHNRGVDAPSLKERECLEWIGRFTRGSPANNAITPKVTTLFG